MRTYTMISRFDSQPLSVLEIAPEGGVRLVVQLVHGICEFKERYIPYLEWLAAHGCLAVMHDHRGHGASARSREELGYFGRHGAEAVVEDMHQLTEELRKRYPGVKLVMIAHSMGSLAARAYAGKYDRDIDALVLTGSPAQRTAESRLGRAVIAAWRLFRGDRYRSAFLWSLATGKKRAPVTPETTFTLSGDLTMAELMLMGYGVKPPRGNRGMKVRFYSGTKDHYAPKPEQFVNAIKKMRAAGYEDVDGRTFEGLKHNILTEDACEDVYGAIFGDVLEELMRG